MITSKLTEFFNIWKKLLTEPQWYWRMSFSTHRQLVSFFVVSGLLLGLSSYAHFIVRTAPTWQTDWQTSLQQLQQNFPSNLHITWNGQRLSNNLLTPLDVPYPSYVSADQFGWPPKLATLEPSQSASSAAQVNAVASASPSSLLTITDSSIIISQQGHQNQIALLDTPGFEVPFDLNRESLPGMIKQLDATFESNFQTWERLAFVIIPSTIVISLLWQSIVPTFLVWLFYKLYHWPYHWSIAWHIVLLVSLVSEVVHQIGLWLYQDSPVPLFNLTFWILIALIFFNAPKRINLIAETK